MKTTEIVNKLQGGTCVRVGEYRATAIDNIKYRSKKTGAAVETDVLRHTVECGPNACIVNQWPPRGETWDAAKILATLPFKKGDRVLIHVTSLEEKNGIAVMGGSLEPLTT